MGIEPGAVDSGTVEVHQYGSDEKKRCESSAQSTGNQEHRASSTLATQALHEVIDTTSAKAKSTNTLRSWADEVETDSTTVHHGATVPPSATALSGATVSPGATALPGTTVPHGAMVPTSTTVRSATAQLIPTLAEHEPFPSPRTVAPCPARATKTWGT